MRRLSVLFALPSILFTVSLADAETVERVVAKVNGQIITLSEFQSRQLEAAQAARVDAAGVGAFLRQNNSRILQDAIDEILLLQKAEDAGLKPPPMYVDEVIGQIRKEHNLGSQQELEAALTREGLTFGELRKNIERRILREMVVRRDIEPKMTMTDAELRAEYEKLRDSDYTTPAKITLQEIVVTDKAGGEAFAQELAAKARAGEDFAALAKAHSSAATREHGGEVGDVAENDMNPELRRVVLALPVGGVSQPLRIEGGYRIVKVTARAAAAVTPFETVKEALRERLMATRFEKEYDAFVQELRKNAQIELRVREVPLQLTGPIPEGSLLEGLETGVGAPPVAPGAAAAPKPAPAAPAGVGDDEIVITPQAAPERITPSTTPAAAAPAPPPAEKPKDAAPGR
jgi:parvulin-like peptidyl-prolyl isomerase